MRRENLTRRFEGDPLLKVGGGAMFLALAFAVVVAVAAYLDRPIEPAAAKAEVKSATEPLVRSDPGFDPWVEKDIPPPRSLATPARLSDKPSDPGPPSESGSGSFPDQSRQSLPVDDYDYPLPTDSQLRAANRSRHYNLPPGAIMSLTINALGLRNVPVISSDSTRALDQGVIHLPGTSYPWSDTPERNVYLAGHRLGWPGTGSHLVFYRLNQLRGGERVTLRDPQGGRYDYVVIESFVVGPEDSWITGRVRGRDLLTLQTCTPIPTFEKRLIVRAERI